MGFKGTFSWFNSLHQGGRKAISFTLKNTNMLLPATFNAAIVDGSNIVPTKYFFGLRLDSGKSIVFNADNESWDWAQGDFFAIIDNDKNILERWDLNLPMRAPGECPECHGSHQCAHCGGNGKILNRHTHYYERCQTCRGTGYCQTCFIPMRQNSPHSPVYSTPADTFNARSSNKKAAIMNRISELEHEIYILEQKNLSIERNGGNTGMWSSYYTNNQLIHSYRMQIINLQATLTSL